jgi:rare lipoprotein A
MPRDAVEAAPQSPKTEQAALRQSGNASWYGPGFHGKLTASGETYDESAVASQISWILFLVGVVLLVVHLIRGSVPPV